MVGNCGFRRQIVLCRGRISEENACGKCCDDSLHGVFPFVSVEGVEFICFGVARNIGGLSPDCRSPSCRTSAYVFRGFHRERAIHKGRLRRYRCGWTVENRRVTRPRRQGRNVAAQRRGGARGATGECHCRYRRAVSGSWPACEGLEDRFAGCAGCGRPLVRCDR